MTEQNFKNRTLYHKDNLDVMRGMNSETIDLIATDPPFNKNRDFHATPDSLASGAKFQDRWSWERDIHQGWIDQITDDFPQLMEAIESARFAHSDGMGAFMCFMAVRLLEMQRLLKATGSIYLHCDPTASHYLKAVMDAVFGWRNFINEIVWCYIDPAGRKNSSHYKRTHDIIFWYAKDHRSRSDSNIPKVSLSLSTIKRYGKYFDANGQLSYESLKSKNPGVFKSLKSVPDDLSQIWLDRNKGTNMPDWWADIAPIKRKGGKQKSEATGYPTQKPLDLYRRIVEGSGNEDSMILDPFCGCATTPVAAELTGRQWVGIDIWDRAHEVVVQRMKDEVKMFGNVHYTTEPPIRTDDKQPAAPFLRVKQRYDEPSGGKMSRADMYAHLLEQYGGKCQGCHREFDDPRYLQLDHNIPRSDGGLNHISNRVLLCGPCNLLKSNIYTLSGLRRKNKKLGYMRI